MINYEKFAENLELKMEIAGSYDENKTKSIQIVILPIKRKISYNVLKDGKILASISLLKDAVKVYNAI